VIIAADEYPPAWGRLGPSENRDGQKDALFSDGIHIVGYEKSSQRSASSDQLSVELIGSES
jgi:hypothetical protein